MGGQFGFDDVTIGLFLDILADVLALLEVGCDDNLGLEVRCQSWVAQGAQDFDAGQDLLRLKIQTIFQVALSIRLNSRGGSLIRRVVHVIWIEYRLQHGLLLTD